MKIMKSLFWLLSLVLVQQATAEEYFTKNTGEPLWKIDESKTLCSLSQDVYLWGKVSYFMEASKDPKLEFEFSPYKEFSKASDVNLFDTPSEYLPGKPEKHLGVVKVFKGFDGYLDHKDAWLTIGALEKGHMAVLSYYDNAYYQGEVRVKVNPFGFKKEYEKFLKCTQNLLPYSFDDIKYTIIHFHEKTTELTSHSAMRLNQIADYIKEDPRIVELTITVHTDKLGELADNQKLTEDQASIIKKFFTDKGVLENKITVRALGQGDSVVLNDTKVNKRINRRVLIEVGRTEVRD